ncbi:hypothetical protein RUND412_009984, partial [Rhizina undulata]
MAQRSARARSKLNKIFENNTTPAPPARTKSGVAKVGTDGLLPPSSSSISGGSSQNSFQFNAAPSKINKDAIRSFFDYSEKIIERLHVGAGDGGKKDPFGNGDVALGLGLGLGAADEKPTIKKWEGGGSRGKLWDRDFGGKMDLQLWFPDGDKLIYLADRQAPPRNLQGLYNPPAPQLSFRRTSKNTPGINRHHHKPSMRIHNPPPTWTLSIFNDREPETMQYLPPARTVNISNAREPETTNLPMHSPPEMAKKRTDLYLTPTTLSYDYVDRGLSEIEYPYSTFIGSPRHNDPKIGNLSTQRFVMEYLRGKEYDYVWNWPEGAASIVVWAESPATSSAYLGYGKLGMGGIQALWREAFVHCTGMLSKLEG